MQQRIVPDLVSNQTLASLPPSATVRDAARIMTERHIGAVLVAVDGRLQGISPNATCSPGWSRSASTRTTRS